MSGSLIHATRQFGAVRNVSERLEAAVGGRGGGVMLGGRWCGCVVNLMETKCVDVSVEEGDELKGPTSQARLVEEWMKRMKVEE